ncbi:NPR1-like protein, putative [Medicago truncatula]|uniref:NPR1-like protein, putative n=1 Tax=Medicago truncatula TaxID=3880 RepID=G7ZXM2_MEDTR|nr:NPR1-like protein, putative [Medicago truncatula]
MRKPSLLRHDPSPTSPLRKSPSLFDDTFEYVFHHLDKVHLNFVGKALMEDVISILMIAFRCQLSQLVKELPHEVSEKVKLLCRDIQQHDGENDDTHVVHATSEFVKLVLNEFNITLDEAGALH